jgi:hypothetical protein
LIEVGSLRSVSSYLQGVDNADLLTIDAFGAATTMPRLLFFHELNPNTQGSSPRRGAIGQKMPSATSLCC